MKNTFYALWAVASGIRMALRVKRNNRRIDRRLEMLGSIPPDIAKELIRIEAERVGLPRYMASMTYDRRSFTQIVGDHVGTLIIMGDAANKGKKAMVAVAGCLLLTAYCSLASAQVFDPPGGCHTPSGEARPCEWYERSYLLPKAQQEQLLPVLLERVLGGNLTNTDPAPRVIDDTARVAAMSNADPYEGWPSTLDLQAETGLTGSRIRERARILGLAQIWATRGGKVLRVYSPADADRIVNMPVRAYRKKATRGK